MADVLNIKNALAGDKELSTKTAWVKLAITANATPASKVHSTDYQGIAYLRTEGKTAEADAIEDLSSDFTTAADNSTGDSQFGILLKGSELSNGSLDEVLEVSLAENPNGSAVATSIAISPAVSGSYVTSGGNIAVDVAGTGLNLASESPDLVLKVTYRVK